MEEAKKQFLEINKSSLDVVSQVIDRLSGLLEESMSGGRNIEYWVGSAHKEISSIKIGLGAYSQAVEDVFESILSQKWDPDSDESKKLMLKVGGEQVRLDESFHRVLKIFESKIKMETTLAEKDAISSIKMIAAVTVLSVFSLVLLFMLLLKKTYSMGRSIEENIELKDALAKLSDELRNESELTLLLDRVLSFLAQQIDAKVQAFYTVSEGKLILSASYAYMKRKSLSNEFAFGEGLVGQCAKEKKIIHISQVPDDYVRICSGTGGACS